MKTPLFPPLFTVNWNSNRKFEYCFFVLNHDPVVSGFVDQFTPFRPINTPFSTVQSPPSIFVQPSKSLPLKIGLLFACSSRTQFNTFLVRRIASYSSSGLSGVDSIPTQPLYPASRTILIIRKKSVSVTIPYSENVSAFAL